MNLYWVTTEDHAEDWFVVAINAKEATTFHEDVEGYEPGDATAEMVMEIPNEIKTDIGWPSDEVLRSCGTKILAEESPCIVEIGNRRFCKGLMESIIRIADDTKSETIGKGRPNETKKSNIH